MGGKRNTLKTIKNRESIHPYSRKAHQISRVYLRKDKLAKKESQKTNPLGERYIWFRYAFEEDKVVATKAEMHELIEQYLSRHDEEIAELEQDRNKGHRKPKAPRQDQLEALKISECNEYISGLELPDMTNGKTLKLLREWDGDKNSMTRMTTIRLQKPNDDTKTTVTTATTTKTPQAKQKDVDAMEL